MKQDILVVGAGPTGLTAALFLAREGHDVTIIDKHSARLPFSRAIAVGPDILTLFADTGVDKAIAAAARPLEAIMLHDDTRPRGRVEAPRGADGRSLLLLEQVKTEVIIESAALDAGARLKRPLALARVEDRGNHALATFRHADETEEQQRFDWIIGADGFHSTVRKSIGIAFEVETRSEKWHAADIEADWPFDAEVVLMPLKAGFCAAFRLPGNLVRTVSIEPGQFAALPSLEPRRIIWQSAFDIHFAHAARYGGGRVWLAGDAAHVHSPAGGRGMNMGIADARALAAAISKGDVTRYGQERHKVAADFVRLNRRVSNVIGLRGWRGAAMRAILRLLAPLVTRLARLVMGRLGRSEAPV